MNGVPAFAIDVRPAPPLNLDPEALTVVARMREIVRRFHKADTDEEAEAAIVEGRALSAAYGAACRTIGIGDG